MVEISRPAESAGGKGGAFGWWALPIVALLGSYAAVPTIGFVWDDYALIVGSPLVTGHAAVAEHFSQPFWSNVLQSARSFYRPLVTLSYAWDYRLWHNWAGGYHLTNLLLHLVCTLLVAALCLRAGAGRPVACLLATAFAVFPRLTESVAWISGRTDPAAAVGALGALLLYKPGAGSWGRKVLAGLSLLAGLLCKETALAAVVGLALFAWMESARPRRVGHIVIELGPIWAALVVYAALRLPVMGANNAEQGLGPRPSLVVFLASSEALFRYGWMLIDPLRPRLQIGDLDRPQPILSGLGVGLAVACLLAMRGWAGRWTSLQWAAIGLGGTALALVLHLIRLDVNIVAADRFVYLPLAALAIGTAPVMERAWRRQRKLVMVGAAVILGSFTIATALRVRLWTNEVALWRAAVAHSFPGAAVPRGELGIALMHQGRHDEALAILGSVAPDKASLIAINQATCLDKVGRRSEAVALLQLLLQAEPKRSRARVNLMLMYARDRRFDEARTIGSRLSAEFGNRLDIQDLVKQVDVASADWAALPVEVADEPTAIRARRAAWFERIGAVPEAQARWNTLALDTLADSELRLKAATYVALGGRASEARAILGALAAEGALASHLPALRAALEGRFDEE
jgi:tetratricopeptide (TPR) repeat protein